MAMEEQKPSRCSQPSSRGPTSNTADHEWLDQVLGKYVSVWLWSITLGATAGLTYAFSSSTYTRGEWGPLNLALAVGVVLGLVVTFTAWVYLLRYLRYFLIPRFLLKRSPDENETLIAARSLAEAFRFVMIGVVLSLAIGATKLVFEALQWGF